MNAEKKKEKRQRLNELGRQWGALRTDGNEAVRMKLIDEIWELIYKLYDRPEQIELLSQIWLEEWPKFDPDKGDLSAFLSYRLEMRGRDQRKQSGKEESLNAGYPGDEEDGKTLEDQLEDVSARDELSRFEQLEQLQIRVFDVLALILTLPERLRGRANNPVRINYFRMFFTDGISNFFRDTEETTSLIAHERDVFSAMKLPFLDFYEAEKCRSIEQISCGSLKDYGALVEGRPMEEVKQPLPNDVYTSYLDRAEQYSANDSAVSQQRQAYFQFMRENLC